MLVAVIQQVEQVTLLLVAVKVNMALILLIA
jgi:hypothetical protein